MSAGLKFAEATFGVCYEDPCEYCGNFGEALAQARSTDPRDAVCVTNICEECSRLYPVRFVKEW